MRLCPVEGYNAMFALKGRRKKILITKIFPGYAKVNQSCLDGNVLELVDEPGKKRFEIKPGRNKKFHLRYVLPAGVACSRLV